MMSVALVTFWRVSANHTSKHTARKATLKAESVYRLLA